MGPNHVMSDMSSVLMRRGTLDTEMWKQGDDMKRHREKMASIDQGERSVTQKQTILPDAWALDFCPPELRGNTFLLFKLLSLWHFVTKDLAN